MYTDPMAFALILAQQREAQEFAHNHRTVKHARAGRRAGASATSPGKHRIRRLRPVGEAA